jgi:isopenicillin N synthase-like dioxygenase
MQTAQDTHQLKKDYAVVGEEIPIIDLGPYLSAVPGAAETATAETAAAEMRDALENIGFFFIIKHGIAKALRERVVAATARFYELPLDKKMALKINHAGVGYIPNKGEFGKHSRY